MIESVVERRGLARPDSAANAIPSMVTSGTRPRTAPRNVTSSTPASSRSPWVLRRPARTRPTATARIPTNGMVADMKNPLCQGAGGYTTTQIRAKGYPGNPRAAGAPGFERSGSGHLHLPVQRWDRRDQGRLRLSAGDLSARRPDARSAPRPVLSEGAVCRSGNQAGVVHADRGVQPTSRLTLQLRREWAIHRYRRSSHRRNESAWQAAGARSTS